jgi:hypothetical protein
MLSYSRFDLPDLLLIHSAGLVFAITRDERNRIARIEQTDHAFHAAQRQPQFLSNVPKINRSGRSHAEARCKLFQRMR